MTNKDFSLFPSPCYIMEEGLLRKNLALIKSVADRAGVEIILAFKSFAMWRSFPIFREYIDLSLIPICPSRGGGWWRFRGARVVSKKKRLGVRGCRGLRGDRKGARCD